MAMSTWLPAAAGPYINKYENNYSSYKGECLAAVWGCNIYRHFLHGRRFILVTDHAPLKWLMGTQCHPGGRTRVLGLHAA